MSRAKTILMASKGISEGEAYRGDPRAGDGQAPVDGTDREFDHQHGNPVAPGALTR